jgi:hypothetical protein
MGAVTRGTRCDGAPALCVVGGAAGPAAQRGHDVAGPAPSRLGAPTTSRAASERDETARAIWREQIAQRAATQFVLVDESGTHPSVTRLYAWAPHDQRDQRATGVNGRPKVLHRWSAKLHRVVTAKVHQD